jgi:riboflavin synthase
MFTGIVEKLGKVVYIRRDKICIEGDLGEVGLGESVMVDGVCLTVTEILGSGRYVMDIGVETLSKTAFSRVRPGSYVNLERAMTLSSRLNGHIVYGHVMTVGKIASAKHSKNTVIITISADSDFIKKLLVKGSVAVNGVSLTVNEIGKNSFKVGVVPETVKRTNLGKLTSSSPVNLEADMLLLK